MKIDYCYHSHTKRCGHASGEDEEYILKAIELGFKDYGVSDHVMWPDHPQPGIRGDYSEIEEYITSILALKEKYKNAINIYVAFECEYTDYYKDYYQRLKDDPRVDYLIQGQHAYIGEDNEPHWYFSKETSDENLIHYANDVIEGMKSGLFMYVAHPDLFIYSFKEWKPIHTTISKMICEAAEKYHMPLEINLCKVDWDNGSGNIKYPCDQFWEIASKYNIEVYVGGDYHSVKHMNTWKYERAYELIEKYNLKVLTKIK